MLSDRPLGSITSMARRHGDRIAVICGQRQLSFIEIDDRAGRLASVLRKRGVGPGVVASIYGPVGWEWIVAYHAVTRLGAIVNPINALLTPEEVSFIVRDCKAHILLADEGRLRSLSDAADVLRDIHTLAFEEVEMLSSDGTVVEPEPVEVGALSTIYYTSGTTGRPKGAMLSHNAVVMNAALTALMHGRTSDDVIVSALPLAHVYGNVVMNSALMMGATLILMPVFKPGDALKAIERHRATRFEGVPTMYYRMLDTPELATADLSSLRMCTVGGQAMGQGPMHAVEARFGCPLIELWGMSEIGGLGTTFPWCGPRTLGSIGFPLPTSAVRTVHPESRATTGPDEPGELQIRGPIVMQGYLNDPVATRAVLDDDGWLSTGDIARIDGHGQIFVLDRMKDVILTSGNNVYPAELERVISGLAGVIMAGVGRDAHPDKGEVPHAYVIAEAGSELTAEAVIKHCRAYLAPYKIPKKVTFVTKLPMTASGKIMRRSLQNRLIEA